ncbi:MAG TPA: hypothetical protein VFA07_13125 [Chthonomonadaceae bacterium]|nr:hypothetical protein [Chthonomonadaceae bacterium]
MNHFSGPRKNLYAHLGISLIVLASVPALGAPPRPQPPKPSQSASPSSAKKTPPPAQKPQSKVTVINGVQISGYNTIHITLGSRYQLSGPNTQILVTNKPAHATLRFHADLVESSDNMVTVNMSGHIRYTISRTPPGGAAQTIQGTASHGIYYSKAKRFEMTGGVDATITDSSILSGPGTVRAERVIMDMASTPFTYTLSGGDGTDTVRLPLREQAAGSAGTFRGGGTVDLHGFATGTLQMGRSAEFSGPDTTIDYANPAERTTAHLQAHRVGAAFGGAPAVLQSLEANGDVRFNAERGSPTGGAPQTIHGHSGYALYPLQDQQLTLSGGVDALLTSPQDLQGPARIAGERVSARLATPARYEIAGSPSSTLLEFTPRRRPAPASSSAGTTAAQTFAIGTVTITGFDRGAFEPGRTADITGPRTSFATADKQAGTSAHLQASHVVATFAPDQTIGNAVASGNVHYQVERPAATGGGHQRVDGTAQRLTLTNTQDTRQIVVQGPLHAEIVDPVHLAAPGHITGQAGDRLTLDLASKVSQFDIDSPNQTATIDFVPRQTSAPASQPVAPARLQEHRSPTRTDVKPGK